MARTMTPEEQSVFEEAVAALAKLPKRQPITVAKAMGKIGTDARTAVRFLSILERMEILDRSGGEAGKPLLWTRKPAGPKALPPPTMQERAAAAGAARKLRSSLWDAAAMGAESVLHIDYSRRRSAWIGMWENLPGF
jgi:predicted DNA-binding transcriptional regulator YafY